VIHSESSIVIYYLFLMNFKETPTQTNEKAKDNPYKQSEAILPENNEESDSDSKIYVSKYSVRVSQCLEIEWNRSLQLH
jgi:hypothetical protein